MSFEGLEETGGVRDREIAAVPSGGMAPVFWAMQMPVLRRAPTALAPKPIT